MKLKRTHIFIYLMVSLFCISMSNEMTVNLQYGENSMYNEIEHTHDSCPDKEETKVKLKVKVCEDLANFNLDSGKSGSGKMFDNENFNKQLFWISNPTPPPEFVG